MKQQIRTILSTLLLLSITFAFTGCGQYINSDKVARLTFEKIIQCLDEDDAEGLKSVFCNIILASPELDEQIQQAMDFFQGKTISYDSILVGGGSAVDNGKITRLSIRPYITHIATDMDKIYQIKFYSYIVYTADTDREGVSKILIKSDDGEECIIGSYELVNG